MKWSICLITGLLAAAPVAAKERTGTAALSATIDRLILDKLNSNGVPPAPLAEDAAFFRRVNLALAGRIPAPSEVRLFLADTDPNKRAKVVDKLLASPAYANHLTATWRNWLLPEAATNFEVAGAVPGFEAWLRVRVQGNVPFDRFVTDLLTAPLGGRPVSPRGSVSDDPDGATNPLAFYLAKDGKPENLAAATSRVFMGVQLECAQCHDHPFARWSRDQFWGLAAFYAGVERPMGGGLRETFDRRELSIPNAERTVPATFLDDKEPEWQFKKSPRVTLAAWLTASDNPFFARAAVNRLWGFLFGVGIVDPIDDFHEQNPPSHPQLLNALAQAFVESDYDVKFLLRAIVLSDAFGRASNSSDPVQNDVRLFARYPVQGLTPEQLFDSFSVAIGGGPVRTNRQQFLETFSLSGKRTESPTTIIQALALMNGGLVGGATTVEASQTLAAVVELPGLTARERIEALYLTVLSRPPRPEELRRALGHVDSVKADHAKEQYADLLWALLNGVEFRTNH